MRSATSYRRVLGLCGLVLLGWAWDAALGGGRAHALAWLLALVLVGGASSLSVRAARSLSRPQEPSAPPQALRPPAPGSVAAGDATVVRVAESADLALLPDVERNADLLFEVSGLGRTPPPATIAELSDAVLVLVVGSPPVGYLRLEEVDGQAHIEGLSVRLTSMKQGVGTALLDAAAEWALAAGHEELTLTTFADVAWNAPFYAGRGFRELSAAELADRPQLREIRAEEDASALARMGRRVAMTRPLTTIGS